MKWEKVTLGAVSDYIHPGPFGFQLHRSDYSIDGIPIIMPKDMRDGKIVDDDLIRVDERHVERLKRHLVHENDIVFARKGDVSKCVFITRSEEGWLTGSDCLKVVLNKEKCYPLYIYCFLRSPMSKKWLEQHSIGATMPSLNTGILSGIEIELPDISTQTRVASIISAYDNLIENNQKQIKLLEEAAQRLYQEWFVKLRFPGYENTRIVDGVPEGWRIICLAEIASILTGKKDANYGTPDGKYPFFTCAQEPIKSPSYSFNCDAVILAGNGDFNVKIFRGKFEAYQRTYIITPNNPEYLYLVFHAIRENMRQLYQGASGSTIKFLTKKMLDSIPVIVPNKELFNHTSGLFKEIQRKIEQNKCQIQLAQEARDRLLPKLMSGEIEL